MRRRTDGLTVILWRDIPAQVNSGSGAAKHQIILARRFQRSIDEAAMVAGKRTASEYVAEWRKIAVAIAPGFGGDLVAAADAYAADLDSEFTRDRLKEYVEAGGWAPDISSRARIAPPVAAHRARNSETSFDPNTEPRETSFDPNTEQRETSFDPDTEPRETAPRATATVVFAPSGLRGEVAVGTTVLDAARQLGADLDSVCGGRGICGRCQVLAGSAADADSLNERTSTERDYSARRTLTGETRLGCAARIQGDLTIEIPDASQVHRPVIRKSIDLSDLVVDPIVRLYYLEVPAADLGTERGELQRVNAARREQWQTSDDATISLAALVALQPALARGDGRVTIAIRNDHARADKAEHADTGEIVGVWPGFVGAIYGAAFDVGSTTIAGHLCDLATGEVVASAGVMNPQIRFGEDLMSRVSYVMMNPGGERELTSAVRSALDDLITTLLANAGAGEDEGAENIERDKLVDIVIVGNPIMHHLVLGIDPTPLGTAPFSLATDEAVNTLATTIDIHCDFASVHFLPCIAGHVGADTAGAVLAVGPHRRDETTLLIDVGTNAELVLGNRDWLYAASSPTGPAFEGAQISCGQRATNGAIERVRIDRSTLEPTMTVIGGDVPITGVCGSGIIEAIGELLLAGVILTDGTISREAARRSSRIVEDGRTFSYVLHESAPRLLITQNDVRAIQLAKAALYAGARLLMDHAGIDRVDAVALAGAFGSHIDPVYALLLGLIPDCDPSTVRAVGNAAGSGAVRALLSGEARGEIARVARTIVKIETAIEPAFQAHFVGAMGIPHSTDPYVELGAVVELPAPMLTSATPTRSRRRARSSGSSIASSPNATDAIPNPPGVSDV